jgi:methylmalonyl-CoA/ethylmalonyl-CoA epimerase
MAFSKNFWRSHINLEASEEVTTSFKSGPNKIEAATNQKVRLLSLSKKKEGIHHIAFDVEDIVAEIALQGRVIVLNEIQKKGADNKLAFLHQKVQTAF